MRGRRDGGMQLDKADVEGGEVRKSEEQEEAELALAPPEGSLRARQWSFSWSGRRPAPDRL